MNAFDQMRESLDIAKQVQAAAEKNSDQMARMLTGNLRHVSGYTLKQIKRELRGYNIHTGKWRAA